MVKAHMKLFEHCFDKFCCKHTLPGSKKWMYVDEFDDFCSMAGLLNDLMSKDHTSHIFAISQFTSEDEYKDNIHFKATSLEFAEMLCRVAKIGSYGPYVGSGD